MDLKKIISRLIPAVIKRTIIKEMMLPPLKISGGETEHRLLPTAVVTRAYNRLEYTIQCVDSQAQQKTRVPHIHLIIDQASDDGTEQWFHWIYRMDKSYWRNIGYVRLARNIGDFGGLALGLSIINDKYKRIMQLDNDIKLISPDTIENLNYALDLLPGDSIVMCRRLGAGCAQGRTGGNVPLKRQSRVRRIKLPHGTSRIYMVNHPVACYLCSRELLIRAIENGCDAACRLADSLVPKATTYKLHDVAAEHIQGWDGQRFLQHEKYYSGSTDGGAPYSVLAPSEIMREPISFIKYVLPPKSDSEWLRPELADKLDRP